jgi:hypothetical protein
MGPAEDDVLGGPAVQPTATPAQSFASRLKVRLALSVAAAAAYGLLAPALAASAYHASQVTMRVDRMHVLAPKSAEFATVFIDADVQHPEGSPHRVVLHSATCAARVNAGDVFVEVPEIRYDSPARISFPAKVQLTAAGSVAPAAECQIDSTVDLFGLGLFKVPRTTSKSFVVAGVTPKMWIQRAGPMVRTWPSLRDPNVTVEQAGLLTMHVVADNLPHSLHDLLGSATISLDASIAYEESDDRSVRLTKTVNASLSTESDGKGGYLISVPVSMSGQVRPAAFAVTVGKMLVGRSRAYDGAPPLNHTSIDRSLRLVAEDPWSPAARSLGDSHVLGWRSLGGSVVNDLWYHVRRRLARKFSRSLMNATGRELDLPLLHQGRRMMYNDTDYMVTFEEMIYFDDSVLMFTAEFKATDAGWDLEVNLAMDDSSLGNLKVDVKEGEGFSMVMAAADESGAEIMFSEGGENTSTMEVRIFDEDGVDSVHFNFYDDGAMMNMQAYVANPEFDGSSLLNFYLHSDADSGSSIMLNMYSESGQPTLELSGNQTLIPHDFGPDEEHESLTLKTYDEDTGNMLEDLVFSMYSTWSDLPVPVEYHSAASLSTFSSDGTPSSELSTTAAGGIEGAEFKFEISAATSDSDTLMNVSFWGALKPYDFSTFYGSGMLTTTDAESGEILMELDGGVASNDNSSEAAASSNFSMQDYGGFNFFDDGAMLHVSAYIMDFVDVTLYNDPDSGSGMNLTTYDESGQPTLELVAHAGTSDPDSGSSVMLTTYDESGQPTQELSAYVGIDDEDGEEWYHASLNATTSPDMGELEDLSFRGGVLQSDMSSFYGSLNLTAADAESGDELLDFVSDGGMYDSMTWVTVELDASGEDVIDFSLYSDSDDRSSVKVATYDESGQPTLELSAYAGIDDEDGEEWYHASLNATASLDDGPLVNVSSWGGVLQSDMSSFYGSLNLTTADAESGDELLDLASEGGMYDNMPWVTVELNTVDEDTGLVDLEFSAEAYSSDNGTWASTSLKTFDGDSGDLMSSLDAFSWEGDDEYSMGANVSEEGQTILASHMEGFTTGDMTESTFSLETFEPGSGDPETQVNMYIMDHEGVSNGFSLHGAVMEVNSTDYELQAFGTHADGTYNLTFLILDGDSELQFKLDPLVVTYMDTGASVSVAVFDGADDHVVTAELALMSGSEDSDEMLLTGSLEVGDSFLQDEFHTYPCFQGSCSLDLSVHDQFLEVGFQSSMPALSPQYSVSLNLVANDTQWSSEGSFYEGWYLDVDLGWDLEWISESEEDSSLNSVLIDVQSESETVVKFGFSMADTTSADNSTMRESMGEVTVWDETFAKWSVSLTESDEGYLSLGNVEDETLLAKWNLSFYDMIDDDTHVQGTFGEVYANNGIGTVKWEIDLETTGDEHITVGAEVVYDGETVVELHMSGYDMIDDDTHALGTSGEVYANIGSGTVKWEIDLGTTGDENITVGAEVVYDGETIAELHMSASMYDSETFWSQGSNGSIALVGGAIDAGWNELLTEHTCTDPMSQLTKFVGDVSRGGEVLMAWDASYGYNETTEHMNIDLSNEDGLKVSVMAGWAENDSAGTEVGTVNFEYEPDDSGDTEPIKYSYTLLLNSNSEHPEISVLNSEGISFFEFRAALDTMTCQLSDFKAEIYLMVRDPEAEDAESMLASVSLTAVSGADSFSLSGNVSKAEDFLIQGLELHEPIDFTGESLGDFVGGEGNVLGAIVNWGFTKQDGLLCDLLNGTFSPFDLFANVSIGGFEVDTALEWADDAWTFVGDVIDEGWSVFELDGGLDELSAHFTTWADSSFMGEDLGDLFAHTNFSISEVENDSGSSEAWEITYIQTDSFISSTNVTWDTSESEAGLPPNFAVESFFKEWDEDIDDWHTVYTWKLVGGTPAYAANWNEHEDASTTHGADESEDATTAEDIDVQATGYSLMHEGAWCESEALGWLSSESHFGGPTVEDCATACQANEECNFVSHSHTHQKCKLTRDCDVMDPLHSTYDIYEISRAVDIIAPTPSPLSETLSTYAPTPEPTPEPTPLPVYAMVHAGGFCKQGVWVVADDIEECALQCSIAAGCVYFSYSSTSSNSCKLNADCNINDYMNTYNIYMMDATPSPTAAPTPMPPPTPQPTPAPTPPVAYGMIHAGGMCKGGSWVDDDPVSVEECAILCSVAGAQYFSHDGSSCKLNPTCDRINDNYNDFDIYQLGATPAPTFAPTPAPPPTSAPTPQPTNAPQYSWKATGRCKGGSLAAVFTTADDYDCAVACDANTACGFFSWRTDGSCKLSANCNRINQWDSSWTVYQMDA